MPARVPVEFELGSRGSVAPRPGRRRVHSISNPKCLLKRMTKPAPLRGHPLRRTCSEAPAAQHVQVARPLE